MKAIAVVPGTTTLRLVDRPEPAITTPDEVKVRILRVGICGTDREEASGGRALAPDGQADLVLGHEMLGQVVEVGKAVTRVRSGDYAVFTVRRECGRCLPCAMRRPDMCLTGEYRERGIWRLNGYQAEYVVDKEQYIVRVPQELEPIGVLVEPTSVAEKAIDEAVRLKFVRLPDVVTPNSLYGGRWLVAGLGPIGLLSAMILRLRGAEVSGLDIVDAGTPRAQWLTSIGGTYVDAREVPPDRVAGVLGPVDNILEATGVPALAFNLLDALAPDGILVLTGIPGGDRPLQIPGAELVRRLVLDNQVIAGSVNAAPAHFQTAVDDLQLARQRWGFRVTRLITHRFPVSDYEVTLRQHQTDEIKAVIEWT